MSATPRVTDYDRYIRTAELLACQKPADQLAVHDELLFQMTHQVCELWMKLALHELRHACELMDADDLLECTRILARVRQIVFRVTEAFPLVETILPVDFHAIREGLGHGSGSESPGFRALLAMPQEIWPHVTRLMERHDLDFVAVVREPRRYKELTAVIQGLMDYDEQFMQLRYVHFALARRVLGTGVLSLKHIPVATLIPGATEPAFPELWKAVDTLTIETHRTS